MGSVSYLLLPFASLLALASATNWCGNGMLPSQTIPCPDGKCDCTKSQCPVGTTQRCGASAIYCCPGGGLMGGLGGMGMGMGGLGMLGGMGGMGMLGLGMPGSMCGGMLGMMGLGGMGGGCMGGSMCQAPLFQGMAQQMLFQRQIQMMLMQMQLRRLMQPRLGMSIRVCTCPPGMYSMQGMCQPFGGGMIGLGGQCGMGGLMGMLGGGMGGGGCVPNALCLGGQCQCQPGFLPTGQYCSPLAQMMGPLLGQQTASAGTKSVNGK